MSGPECSYNARVASCNPLRWDLCGATAYGSIRRAVARCSDISAQIQL